VSQAVSRYQQNDVFSMSPARRVVFLYGQALAGLRQAGRHLERGEIESRSRCLTRAREILGELLTTLDFEQGGDIARNLAGLYAWFMSETVEIDFKPDPARLERMTLMVAELHAAWDQAAQQVAEPAPSMAAGA